MNPVPVEREPEFARYRPYYEQDLEGYVEIAKKIPQGYPDTFGATPLNRFATLMQQSELLQKFLPLVGSRLPGVPRRIHQFIRSTFQERFTARAVANDDNYSTSLINPESYDDDPVLAGMITDAELGHANPAEILLVRDLVGIRSAELASLTHPYGRRIDPLLDIMRNVVQMSVESLGGEYYENPETVYRVKHSIDDDPARPSFPHGVLMTRKRTIGVMPDGTLIRERSSFVLRTGNGSPVTTDMIAAMWAVDPNDPDWQEKVVTESGLDVLADELLDTYVDFDMAIPISTTIYAYNPQTARLVSEAQAYEFAQRQTAYYKQSNLGYSAQKEEMRPFGNLN